MQMSRKSVDPRVWERVWECLVQFVQKSGDEIEISDALAVLLGPAERVIVAKRLMIGVLTINGWDAPTIAEFLKMSKPTVYKHRVFIEMNPDYKKTLHKIFPHPIKLEKTKNDEILLEKILKSLYAIQHGSRHL